MRGELIGAALIALVMATTPAAAAPPSSGRVAWVIDGDTFRLASGERIRIADIDAPETRTDQAKCAEEQVRGKAVTREAIAMLKGREVAIMRVGKSYNRTVARVSLNGQDVGEMFVAKGLARPWLRGHPKPIWCGA